VTGGAGAVGWLLALQKKGILVYFCFVFSDELTYAFPFVPSELIAEPNKASIAGGRLFNAAAVASAWALADASSEFAGGVVLAASPFVPNSTERKTQYE
jgi:hypothetical protein